MPAFALTAAEIAAAEAAAIAAAEAAAVHAAQVAAAQAAQAAAAQAATQAATTAAANTAAATATNAATNQSVLQAIGASPAAPASAAQLGGYGGANAIGAGSGISSLGAGAGTGANLGYETLAKEVGTGGLQDLLKQPLTTETLPGLSPEISNLTSGAQRIADTAPVIEQTAGYGLKGSMTNAAPLTPDPAPVTFPVPNTPPVPPVVNPGPAPHLSALPEFNPQQYLIDTMPGSVPPAPPAPPVAPLYGSTAQVPTYTGQSTFPDIYKGDSSLYGIKAPGYSSLNVRPDLTGPSPYSLGNETANYNIAQMGPPAPPQEPGGLQGLFNQGVDYVKNNKLSTALGANALVNYLDKPDPYEKPKYKSTFKPGLYSGYTPVQPTPYQPNYAVGGIADLGGYSDYARGGRLLKGPGDGMSDDIPATIANKQPARLANEEFVVPADVVSHLGNGSSEAGAKVLYKMMERVRKARTGNKKQGKQINPEKYLA